MLLHRVGKSVGTAERNGKTLYGYRAACGVPLVAASPLIVNSTIAIGPEPHAQCAGCFKEKEEHVDATLPLDDPLAGAVYDEKGRRLDAVREREPGKAQRMERDMVSPIKDDNGLGQLEDRPYG